MNQAEKDKLSKYGKVVWDFANAKTTDDVLISFFYNLQSAFNFSSDFKERALLQYPTKKLTIDTLSSSEYDLLKMLLRRDKILKSCNELLCVFNEFISIGKYDPVNFMFTIDEQFAEFSNPIDGTYSLIKTNSILIPSKNIEAYINNIQLTEIAKEEVKIRVVPGKDIKTVLKKNIKALIAMCHEIEDFKKEATNRFAEVEKIAGFYPKIFKIHDHLKAIQRELKTTLLEIIEAEQAYESERFKRALEIYNSNFKKIYTVTNNKIVEFDTFNERFFLGSLNEYIFNVAINFCLIGYLKNPEYLGKERLTICQKCHCIFSKSRLNSQQHYCPVCSRKNKMTKEERAKYMAGWRKEQKKRQEKDKKRRLDKEISNLLAEGIKPKEAQELAELKIKDK